MRLILRIVFFAFILLNINTIYSQSEKDSLIKVLAKQGINDTTKLNTLHDLTKQYLFTQPDSAEYFAQQQFDLAEQISYKAFMADALSSIGISWALRGDLKLALDFFERDLVLRKEVGKVSQINKSYNNIALIHEKLGNTKKALDYHELSVKLKEEEFSQNMNEISFTSILAGYVNLGTLFYQTGNYNKAKINYDKGLQLYNDHLEMAQKSQKANKYLTGIYGNLGSIKVIENDMTRALEYFKQGRKIEDENDFNIEKTSSYLNMGSVFMMQGLNDKALDLFFESLKISKKISYKLGVESAYNQIGAAFSKLGEKDSAISYYNKSLSMLNEMEEKSKVASTLNNLGAVYMQSNNFDQAYQSFVEALNISNKVEGHRDILIAKNNLGDYFFNLSDYDSSIYYCNSALLAMDTSAYKILYGETNRMLYKNYLIKNNDSMNDVINSLKDHIFKSIEYNYFALSEKEKEIYFQGLENDFHLYYDYGLYKKDVIGITDSVLNTVLKIKGITLKSTTALKRKILESNDDELIDKYEQWIQLRKDMVKAYQNGEKIDAMDEKINTVEKEIIKKSKAFNDFNKTMDVDWRDVQSSLKKKEAAVEFVHFKSIIDSTSEVIYAALIVTKDCEHPKMIRLCSEKDLVDILGKVQGNNMSFVDQVYGTKDAPKTELYQLIWQPLEQSLKGAKSVYISPSGLLHKVAFHVLSPKKEIYLCDRYDLKQVNTTGVITLDNSAMINKNGNFLLLGGIDYQSDTTDVEFWDYLPGTQGETQNISSLLDQQNKEYTLLTSNQASESNLKRKVKGVNVIHFATHGFFFPDPEVLREEVRKSEFQEDIIFRGQNKEIDLSDNKSRYANWAFLNNKNSLMRTGLVLSGANDVWQRSVSADGEDGILTAEEVKNMDLSENQLVVLSACETGLGDIKGSEGVYGLQRSFKLAGANYLIMSLWQVPDKETSEFMQEFYKTLIKSNDIELAFEKARSKMRGLYDPYYWGAFILVK